MSYLAFDREFKTARKRLPKNTCDCHFHVFDNFQKYPFADSRSYTPTPATVADYQAMANAYGIERAVLVHPSVYGADHSSFEDILAENSAWMRGVAVAFPDTPEEDIARWAQIGTKGTRINALLYDATPESIRRIIDKVKVHDWHVQLFADLINKPDLASHIVDQGVKIVVDHLGHGDPEQLIKSKGFSNLLALLREGRAWVKLSAPYRSSIQQPNYPDTRALVEAIVKARPTQAVWGTDWPHPMINGPMPNDGDLVNTVFDWLSDAALLEAVLVDNPTHLYWGDQI